MRYLGLAGSFILRMAMFAAAMTLFAWINSARMPIRWWEDPSNLLIWATFAAMVSILGILKWKSLSNIFISMLLMAAAELAVAQLLPAQHWLGPYFWNDPWRFLVLYEMLIASLLFGDLLKLVRAKANGISQASQ